MGSRKINQTEVKLSALLSAVEKALAEENYDAAILSLIEIIDIKKKAKIKGTDLADAYYDLANAYHERSYGNELAESEDLKNSLQNLKLALKHYPEDEAYNADIAECERLKEKVTAALNAKAKAKKSHRKNTKAKRNKPALTVEASAFVADAKPLEITLDPLKEGDLFNLDSDLFYELGFMPLYGSLQSQPRAEEAGAGEFIKNEEAKSPNLPKLL